MIDFILIKKEALKYITRAQKANENNKAIQEFSALCSAQAILTLLFGKNPVLNQTDCSLFENLDTLNVKYEKCVKRRKQLEKLLKLKTEPHSPTKIKVSGSRVVNHEHETPVKIDKRKLKRPRTDIPEILEGYAYTNQKRPKLEEPEDLNIIDENSLAVINIPDVDFSQSELCGVTFQQNLTFEQDLPDLVVPPEVNTLALSVDHDYLQPEDLQQVQYPDGYYSVSKEMLNRLKERYKGEENSKPMMTKKFKNGKNGRRLVPCSNTDPDHQICHQLIKEWFPTAMAARLRSKVLDPFNYFKEKNSSKHADNDRRGHCFAMNCREYDCGAHLVLRKVAFSDSGYEWGLFGCMTHNHEEKLNNRMELVFDNYNSAMEFHNHYFEPQYKKSSGSLNDAKNYGIYTCRRTTLEGKHGDGKCPCDSKIHFKLAFVHMTGKDNEEAKNHPFSLFGNFFHKHPRDPKYFNVPILVKNFIDSELEKGINPTDVFKNFVPDVNQKNPTIDYIRDRLRLMKRRIRLNKEK